MPTRSEAKKAIWDALPHEKAADKDAARKAIVEFMEANGAADIPQDVIDAAVKKPKKGKR